MSPCLCRGIFHRLATAFTTRAADWERQGRDRPAHLVSRASCESCGQEWILELRRKRHRGETPNHARPAHQRKSA